MTDSDSSEYDDSESFNSSCNFKLNDCMRRVKQLHDDLTGCAQLMPSLGQALVDTPRKGTGGDGVEDLALIGFKQHSGPLKIRIMIRIS